MIKDEGSLWYYSTALGPLQLSSRPAPTFILETGAAICVDLGITGVHGLDEAADPCLSYSSEAWTFRTVAPEWEPAQAES